MINIKFRTWNFKPVASEQNEDHGLPCISNWCWAAGATSGKKFCPL